MKNLICAAALGVVATSAAFGEELKSGTRYSLESVPAELTARAPVGTTVRFALEENGTTGYQWAIGSNTNECEVVVEHRGASTKGGLCGAPGTLDVAVTSKVKAPVRVEFNYRRPWEKDVKPIKSVLLVLHAADGN